MIEVLWDTYHTKGLKPKSLLRFMKAKWVFEMLKSGNMSMARMDTFEDKFEGIATGNIISMGLLPLLKKNSNWNSQLTIERINTNKENVKYHLRKAREQLNNIQINNYVCCWFMADRESVAMWDLYAKDGLAIQLNRIKFQNRVKSQLSKNILPPYTKRLVAGKISYHDFREVAKNQRSHMMKYLAFRKDKSFDHEKEYRMVLNLERPCQGLKRFNYSLGNILELELNVIASPRMSDEKFAQTEKTLKKINPDLQLYESELRPWYKFMEIEF